MVDLTIPDKIYAIIHLRMTLISRGLQRDEGVPGLVIKMIILLVGSIISIGLAVLFAVVVRASVGSGDLETLLVNLKIAFYLFLMIGVVFPIMLQNFKIGIDTTGFRLFPISHAWLYAVTVSSGFASLEHLMYYPALVAIYIAGVLSAGGGAAIGTAVILLLIVFYVVLGSTIALVVQSIIRKRRTREILTVLFFFVLAVTWLTHFTFKHGWINSLGPFSRVIDYLRAMPAAYNYIPPAIAADAITSLHKGEMEPALHGILHLLIWATTITAIGYLVFSRLQRGERGRKSKDIRAAIPRSTVSRTAGTSVFDLAGLSRLPVETYAVVTKELRYVMRSAMGRGLILLVPCITAVHSLMIRGTVKSAVMDIQPGALGFLIVSLYITIVMGNHICNSFQWERGGIQIYFMSPASLVSIIAGKNLGIVIYAFVLYGVNTVTYGVITYGLDPVTLTLGILVFANSILTTVIVGNFLTVKYPVPHDESSMRRSLAQTAQLVLFIVLLVIIVYTAAAMIIPFMLGVSVLRLPLLFVMLALQAAMYRITLGSVAHRMNNGREILMDRLMVKSTAIR